MSSGKGRKGSFLGSISSWFTSTTPPPQEEDEAPVEQVQVETPQQRRARLVKEKLDHFETTLNAPKINFKTLQQLCSRGISDKPGLRQSCWLILLHVLPLEPSKWDSTKAHNVQLWKGFVQDLVINPRDQYNKSQKDQNGVTNGSSHGAASSSSTIADDDPLSSPDHPLSQDKSSTWNAYFKDCELQAEIKKDVNRTFPTLHFFRQGREEHLDALEKILFIWCKLNPGVSYVQGMNEVLGPLYYLFATDPKNLGNRAAIESNAFFAFTNLMSEIMNNFIKTLDGSEVGIVRQIELLNLLLQEKDPQLWKDLERKKLNLQFFAFRQLTLLLSQEFELPEVLRLWDSLFSDPERFKLLRYTCCSMLMLQRQALLTGDFAHNLKLMQSYPSTDIEEILSYAIDLVNNPEFEPPFLDLDLLPKPDPAVEYQN